MNLGTRKKVDKQYQYTLWGKEVVIQIPKERFPTESELQSFDAVLPGCQHGWFESNGCQLHYLKFVPKTKPRGICVFLHGIQGYCNNAWNVDGRKLNTALLSDECLKKGYALYTLDMRGHGFSEGDRFYVPDYRINRDDLDGFARFAASEHDEDTPLFLMGESYGACLALHVTSLWQSDRGPKGLTGTVVQAPAVIGELPDPVTVFVLRRCLAPLFPKWVPFFMVSGWEKVYEIKILVVLFANNKKSAASCQPREYMA